jgi:protein phosphatase
MKYEYACQTDIGLFRNNNEDSYWADPDLNLFIVADGMGGYDKGEVASQMTCVGMSEYLRDIRKEHSIISKNHFLDSVQKANADIRKKIQEIEPPIKMGSTVVSLLMRQDKLLILNVGDSRAYLLRKGKLQQISVDHSLIEEIRAGGIKKELSAHFKNIITRGIGMKDTVEADVFVETPEKEDLFLLCSDGLHGFVDDGDIQKILVNGEKNLQIQVDQLIDAAKKNGGKDNITGILIRVLEADETVTTSIDETFQTPAYLQKKHPGFFSPLQIKILLTTLVLVVFWIAWSLCHSFFLSAK